MASGWGLSCEEGVWAETDGLSVGCRHILKFFVSMQNRDLQGVGAGHCRRGGGGVANCGDWDMSTACRLCSCLALRLGLGYVCVCVCVIACAFVCLCLEEGAPCLLLRSLALLPICWGTSGRSLSYFLSCASVSPSIPRVCPAATCCCLCKAEPIRTFDPEILEALGFS